VIFDFANEGKSVANGVPKKQQLDEELRKKRVQAVSAMGCAAKVPSRPILVIAAKRSRPSVGRATAMPEPLPPAHYPIKRAALGNRQVALADD
jgi:hypothetical protein